MKKWLLMVLLFGVFGSLRAEENGSVETDTQGSLLGQDQSGALDSPTDSYSAYVWQCNAWSVYGPQYGGTFYWVAANPYFARQQAVSRCNFAVGTACYNSCFRIY